MKSFEFTVLIAPNGETTIKDIKGVRGPACKKLTEEFEKTLGKKLSEQKTGDYYQKEQQKVNA